MIIIFLLLDLFINIIVFVLFNFVIEFFLCKLWELLCDYDVYGVSVYEGDDGQDCVNVNL